MLLLSAAGAVHAGAAVVEASVEHLQRQMAAGRATSQSITQDSLDRIRQLDGAGPRINAVLETNPQALAIARSLDRERKAGKVRGPLHGIPVLLKDNIDTGDRMLTTAGSLALLGAPAGRDAFIGLERARRADEEPLCARAQPLRFQLGHWLGDRGELRGGGPGHGDGWVHRLPQQRGGAGGHQADGGAGEPQRHHPHLTFAGHGRADDAQRGRRGRGAHSHRGRRSE
jgi:hypothetical protein